MCGIFSYFDDDIDFTFLREQFMKIKNRGPDSTIILKRGDAYLGFHRLQIVDLTANGNQPFSKDSIHLICNGEIYNHKNLKKEFNLITDSKSDCEVILHLFLKYGLKKTCQLLDGVFAFVIYDSNKNEAYIGRDPYGVRPLFIGYTPKNKICLASEMKAIDKLSVYVNQFKPGNCMTYNLNTNESNVTEYNNFRFLIEPIVDEYFILSSVRNKLINAVEKRLMSERPIGALLSGGLDSSLIAAITSKYISKYGKLNTFAIGLKDATDLKYAQMVAEHIGSRHHTVILTEKEFIDAIPEVIYHIESYDTTTVRASVGNYLISKYIKNNTDIVVVYNGDGSDELGGYIYLKNAPNDELFQKECHKLIRNIHSFDVLRSDRSISSNWGLEARTPFLDKEFVDFYMKIDPKYKNHSTIEKNVLRKAFEKDNLLPKDVLWRKKEAFSDGCSSNERSWHTIIKEHVDKIITDEDFDKSKNLYNHNPPQLKESLYYRRIFCKYFPKRDNVIPYYWLPNWSRQIDPSARELANY